MGQIEILNTMMKYRLMGDDEYKSPKSVYQDLQKNGHQIPNVAAKLNKLYEFGYLERKELGMWRNAYRSRLTVARSLGKKTINMERIK